MEASRTDAELVAEVLAGNHHAFRTLVGRHQEFLYRYATRMLGDRQDAADVLQESFLRAFRSLDRCRDPADFRAWLFVIVANQCRTAGAARRRHDHVPLDAVPEAIGAVAPEAGQDDGASLRGALARLGEDDRELLTLKYLEDQSVDDIGRLLGLTRSAVKMRLLRAREALRRLLPNDRGDL